MFAAVGGLLAGAAHVATGPDHLAAVAPLAADSRRGTPAAWVGVSWGFGHGLGVLVIGGVGQAVKASLNIDAFASWAEVLVGVMLIVLGLWTLARARRLTIHEHSHRHGGTEHTHLHVHEAGKRSDGGHGAAVHVDSPHGHRHAALGIGVLHGFAGSNHLLGVVPSLVMEWRQAAAYLGGYFVAAVLTMALFGAAVGWVIHAVGTDRIPVALRVAGGVSIGVGVVWLVWHGLF